MKKITLLIVALLGLGIGMGEAQYTNLINFTLDTGSYIGVYPLWGSLTISGDTLYGMTFIGGINGYGNIFSVQTDGTNYKDFVDFTGTSGSYIGADPYGSLTLSGDTLYGMTRDGGTNGYGNIFSVQTNGTNFKDLVDFIDTPLTFIGLNPTGSLTLSGNTLYGMTEYGGPNNYGNIFSVQTNGTNFRNLILFTGTYGPYPGQYPCSSLILSGGTLYGMTFEGGINSAGNIFSVQTDGTNYNDLLDFNGFPYSSLTLSGDTLYGMTFQGGINGYGNIFSVLLFGTNYKDLIDFTGTSGSYIGEYPEGSLTLSGDTLYGMTSEVSDGGISYEDGNIFSVQTNGTNYKNLIDFTGTNGSYIGKDPRGSLILSSNTLYGMTFQGGVNGYGNIFRYYTGMCTLSTLASASTNVSCSGGSNGAATANPSGGIPPLTYTWNNSQTNATATGLSAGIYSVNVTDSVGCSGSASVTITQPPLLQDSINSECATCCNCKGTTHVYVWGGISPYTYSWSNGRTNDTLMGLASGTYTATVWDSNRCMITDSIFVHEGPSISKYQTNENCYGDANGSATITVDGNYSYSWNPGGETTASINGLSAGAYNVTITNNDTAGCSVTYSFSITQPDSLFLADGFGVNGFISCADTDCIPLFFQAYGGTPPYTYINLIPPIWMLCNSGGISGTVIDANGCSASIPNGTGVEFGLSIRVEINNNAGCNGENYGNATVSIHTGSWSTYAYSWNPGGGTNQTETSLSAGTYTVTVTAINPNCATSAIIAISQSPAIILTADTINASPGNCDGSAWATVSGGVAPYTYNWNPGGLTTDSISNQCAGAYCCIITDANGCIDSVCTNIETSTGINQVKGESEKVKVYPNPNDGVFTVVLSHAEPVSESQTIIEVYSVLGKKIYDATLNPPAGGQGDNLIDLSSQPNGVYFYRVLCEDGSLIGEGKLVIEK